jgi:GAF domain-containing protein
VAYLDDRKFKDNLRVRAVKGVDGRPARYVIYDSLYDLFRPVVSKPLSFLAQQTTGIKQVIAVPIFLEDEVVGNLFAAARREFSEQDIAFLTGLGHQAATAIESQRRLAEIHTLERVILALQASMTDEKQVLQIIVDAVVNELDFVGAMVATLEAGNVLPVRAYSISFAQDFIETWEKRLGVGFLSPSSVAYLDSPEFKYNLSARAVKGIDGRPAKYIISDSLYDLFRPVVNRPLSAMAQKFTGIQQVIAVPFFLEDEVVGNLFAATRRPRFSKREIELLTLLGQQAAVGIRNARIYRKSEERRQAAEIFARMAFSSAAYVHALRNHVGVFRMYTQLVKSQLNGGFQELGTQVNERLNQATDILDNLHEPWRETPDALTDVNVCLKRALDKVVPDHHKSESKEGVVICLSLAEKLPLIQTSPDMLSEAFKVLIKNAVEAVKEKWGQKGQGKVWIESRQLSGQAIEVQVRDNGIGIKPENLSKVFEFQGLCGRPGWNHRGRE